MILAIRKGRPLPGPGQQRAVDLKLHGAGDRVALGDVVDGKLHHAVAHAFPDRVDHHVLDLLLGPELDENLGRLGGIDLPRTATSTFMLICSLESASMVSAPCRSVGHCSSRVEYFSTDDHGKHESHAAVERQRVHLPEGVPHAHLAGVDHHHAGAGQDQQTQHQETQAHPVHQRSAGASSAVLRLDPAVRRCDQQNHRTKDDRTHRLLRLKTCERNIPRLRATGCACGGLVTSLTARRA